MSTQANAHIAEQDVTLNSFGPYIFAQREDESSLNSFGPYIFAQREDESSLNSFGPYIFAQREDESSLNSFGPYIFAQREDSAVAIDPSRGDTVEAIDILAEAVGDLGKALACDDASASRALNSRAVGLLLDAMGALSGQARRAA